MNLAVIAGRRSIPPLDRIGFTISNDPGGTAREEKIWTSSRPSISSGAAFPWSWNRPGRGKRKSSLPDKTAKCKIKSLLDFLNGLVYPFSK